MRDTYESFVLGKGILRYLLTKTVTHFTDGDRMRVRCDRSVTDSRDRRYCTDQTCHKCMVLLPCTGTIDLYKVSTKHRHLMHHMSPTHSVCNILYTVWQSRAHSICRRHLHDNRLISQNQCALYTSLIEVCASVIGALALAQRPTAQPGRAAVEPSSCANDGRSTAVV